MTVVPTPLIITHQKLDMHFEKSGSILTAAVDSSAQLQVEPDYVSSRVIGGLYGSACENISRNRGRRVHVAPLLDLGRGMWAWLGYHEEWDEERRNRNTRRFSFRSVGISIYIGPRNNEIKLQVFRAEWAGWARWNGDNYCFQATSAAHPHWQFDALDSLHDDDLSQRTAQSLRHLSAEAKLEIREFGPQLSEANVRDIVTTQKLSSIHFASAATWWKSSPHGGHAHSPNDPVDVENWVQHSIDYIKLELKRL